MNKFCTIVLLLNIKCFTNLIKPTGRIFILIIFEKKGDNFCRVFKYGTKIVAGKCYNNSPKIAS